MSCKGADDLARLNVAFKKKFGHNLPLDLTYRTYAEQVEMKKRFGRGAATPGTSNHGWGNAIDLPDYRFSTVGKQYRFGQPKYEWLKKNAPKYNWVAPKWAQKGGSLPEPWHFEYVG